MEDDMNENDRDGTTVQSIQERSAEAYGKTEKAVSDVYDKTAQAATETYGKTRKYSGVKEITGSIKQYSCF